MDDCGHVPKRLMRGKACSNPFPPPLRGKQLSALRAVAATPGGLRLKAYRSAMPLLDAMGLIELRAVSRTTHPDGRVWFLTPAGRETVRAYGEDET